jgi:hypothetical protein
LGYGKGYKENDQGSKKSMLEICGYEVILDQHS